MIVLDLVKELDECIEQQAKQEEARVDKQNEQGENLVRAETPYDGAKHLDYAEPDRLRFVENERFIKEVEVVDLIQSAFDVAV